MVLLKYGKYIDQMKLIAHAGRSHANNDDLYCLYMSLE